MKLVWKNKKSGEESARKRPRLNPHLPFEAHDDDEEDASEEGLRRFRKADGSSDLQVEPDAKGLDESLQSQGNKLAEEGMYKEALAKWKAALMVTPENAVLHEQMAQVLLEMGDAWGAVNAATRAAKLDPSWAEAWITLARAQLNYGEPDAAIDSFDKALAIKPDLEEANVDRAIAQQLVNRRNQLHFSGSNVGEGRILVVDRYGDDHEVAGATEAEKDL